MIDKISVPVKDLRVLLLEGINESAVDLFRSAGFERIERLTKALDGDDLKRAIADAHILGIRSRTSLTADALAAAQRLAPVAMKAVGAALAHKTELGAVKLGIATAERAGAAYDELARLSDRVLVERMAASPVAELIVGAARDPALGLHLMIGAGGVLA